MELFSDINHVLCSEAVTIPECHQGIGIFFHLDVTNISSVFAIAIPLGREIVHSVTVDLAILLSESVCATGLSAYDENVVRNLREILIHRFGE